MTPLDYGYGLLSFFTVAFGGLAIGVLMGLVSGLLTRATREVRNFAFFGAFLFYFCEFHPHCSLPKLKVKHIFTVCKGSKKCLVLLLKPSFCNI